jgi:hypothetical protein
VRGQDVGEVILVVAMLLFHAELHGGLQRRVEGLEGGARLRVDLQAGSSLTGCSKARVVRPPPPFPKQPPPFPEEEEEERGSAPTSIVGGGCGSPAAMAPRRRRLGWRVSTPESQTRSGPAHSLRKSKKEGAGVGGASAE